MTTPPTPLPSISPEGPGAPPAGPKSHTLAWILGGCGTVLVLAIIAGILGLRSFMKNHVHRDANGGMVIDVPGGGTVHEGKAEDIGIPIYPETNLGAIGMEVTSPRQELVMSAETYFSRDAVEKVDAWYRANLSKDYVREGAGQKQILPNNRRFPVPLESNSITYVLKNGNAMNVVALTQAGMTTKIVLMKTGAAAAQ
ncbi:MAG: hypothetical protein WAM91_09315 [Candidatus Acidiferrales bacterium]